MSKINIRSCPSPHMPKGECGHINQIMTAHVTGHWICSNQPCECNKLLLCTISQPHNCLYKLNKMFTTSAEFTEQFGYKQ